MSRYRNRRIFSLAVLLSTVSFAEWPAYAHKGHHHHAEDTKGEKSIPENPADPLQQKLKLVGVSYADKVKPIFQKSCFDCHSDHPAYPWYYRLPGVKHLIDSDIDESKEHLNLTNGFPFAGHGTPDEDLQAIADAVQDGSMPPFRYRIMHPKNRLTDEDRAAILGWVKEGQKTLGSNNPQP